MEKVVINIFGFTRVKPLSTLYNIVVFIYLKVMDKPNIPAGW
jgi:hypothetical protein